MAGTGSSRQPKFLSAFQRLSIALSNHDQCFCLRLKQVLCFESLIDGSDVIAVLPTKDRDTGGPGGPWPPQKFSVVAAVNLYSLLF